MSKKHFEALAAALVSLPIRGTGDVQHYDVCHAVALVCARFNPNFDRARFLKACGVEG